MRAPQQAENVWLSIVMLILLGTIAIIIEASPLGFQPSATPSPDLLFCVAAFWAVRRPAAAHILVIVTLAMIRDLLTDVPVGAGALLLVLGVEVLKWRHEALARSSFLVEWLTVALTAAVMLVLLWSAVLLTFLQPPYLLDLGEQWVLTALTYPVLALVFRWVFQIKPLARVASASKKI